MDGVAVGLVVEVARGASGLEISDLFPQLAEHADRLAVMAALGAVDVVTWFDEDTPIARILDCQPDVLVKGGDWPVERIVGAPETFARGGHVHSIPFEHERSTTALLTKIRRL